jgi:YVTN family beta-propeller protein
MSRNPQIPAIQKTIFANFIEPPRECTEPSLQDVLPAGTHQLQPRPCCTEREWTGDILPVLANGGSMKMQSKSVRLLVTAVVAFSTVALSTLRATAQTPSPALLVLEKADEWLAIVDPATLKVVARVPSGGAPHEIVASADGKFAYISNYASQQLGQLKTISVVDLVAQKVLAPVDLGMLRAPHGLAMAGGKVYFTAEASKVIGRFDPATNQVDWVLGTGQNFTHMVAVSKDLKTMFTSNIGSDSLCDIEQTRNGRDWNVTVIPVGKGPEGFDISPDGKELWAAKSQDGTVSIIDTAAKKVVQTVDAQINHSNRLKFTPDGKLALISDTGSNALVVMETASRSVRKRINVGKEPEGILVQPGGAKAYVAVSGDNAVTVIDLKTLAVTGKIVTGSDPDGLAWAQR